MTSLSTDIKILKEMLIKHPNIDSEGIVIILTEMEEKAQKLELRLADDEELSF